MTETTRFTGFGDFYPHYLSEHANRLCRRTHFIGSTLALLALFEAILTGDAWWLIGMPIVGYGAAWIGHFVFEKNRPATFRHPLYSLMGDWVMYKDMLLGRLSF